MTEDAAAPAPDEAGEAACKDVGERIQLARQRALLTQTALAERLGVHQGTVSHWESGHFDVGVTTLLRIAEALGVAASSLLPAEHQEADEFAAVKAVTRTFGAVATKPCGCGPDKPCDAHTEKDPPGALPAAPEQAREHAGAVPDGTPSMPSWVLDALDGRRLILSWHRVPGRGIVVITADMEEVELRTEHGASLFLAGISSALTAFTDGRAGDGRG